jgi:hypothetical protein
MLALFTVHEGGGGVFGVRTMDSLITGLCTSRYWHITSVPVSVNVSQLCHQHLGRRFDAVQYTALACNAEKLCGIYVGPVIKAHKTEGSACTFRSMAFVVFEEGKRCTCC